MKLNASGNIWIKRIKYSGMASLPFRFLKSLSQHFLKANPEKAVSIIPEYFNIRLDFLRQ